MPDKTIAIGREHKRDVERGGVLQRLLHAIAHGVVMVSQILLEVIRYIPACCLCPFLYVSSVIASADTLLGQKKSRKNK